MRGKYQMSNARTKNHIYTKDAFEANILDDEDDVIFLKKGATFKDMQSSPQSIMHSIVPDMVPLKLPEAMPSAAKEKAAPSSETDEDFHDFEKSLFSTPRLPIKMRGSAEVGVHSRMARYEKNKARGLSKKYWARVRAAKQPTPEDVEDDDDDAEEQWPLSRSVRASSKLQEKKARRTDRRDARDAKCASWYENEAETVVFVPEERPETRFILINRPVIYVPVTPTADPIFQAIIAQDRVIGVPRIPTKIGGADEIGVHSRMARREKQNARQLSKKHWGRVRAAKRAARANHEASFAEGNEEDEAEAEQWPPAPQYTKADIKARRVDRRAARDAKCASWFENDFETVTFAAKPKAKKAKESRPWVSRTELPASVQVIDPEFKVLVDNEVHVDVEADAHYRMAKQSKKSGRELSKKFWSRKREAKAAHAKFEANVPEVDESEDEGAPPPIRSSHKFRSKARRSARREARDAKCAAWADDDAMDQVVFPNKGWSEAMRERGSSANVVYEDVMYEDASSGFSDPISPSSTMVVSTRMAVPRARLKLSFGEAIRSKPISSIRKAHETGRKAHRRNIIETARAA